MPTKRHTITFTHPKTGEVFTRTTVHNYRFVSYRNHAVSFHFDYPAAKRRNGRVYPLPPTDHVCDCTSCR